MPVRREGDQRVEIKNWDSWIEREIAAARDRGEFDNLPTAGKPLDLASTNINPEWDFAFSRLKNAGVMPAWMELDRDCHRQRAELNAFLERSSHYLGERISELDKPARILSVSPRIPIWQFWKHIAAWLQVPSAEKSEKEAPLDRLDLLQMRAMMKDQYLERAVVLDKRITEFNYALPRALNHLERMRMLPERATKLFEAGCPQIPPSSVTGDLPHRID